MLTFLDLPGCRSDSLGLVVLIDPLRLMMVLNFEYTDVQVKVVFTGKLLNYSEICGLYWNCERFVMAKDPALLILNLYLQVKCTPGTSAPTCSVLITSVDA